MFRCCGPLQLYMHESINTQSDLTVFLLWSCKSHAPCVLSVWYHLFGFWLSEWVLYKPQICFLGNSVITLFWDSDTLSFPDSLVFNVIKLIRLVSSEVTLLVRLFRASIICVFSIWGWSVFSSATNMTWLLFSLLSYFIFKYTSVKWVFKFSRVLCISPFFSHPLHLFL